MAVLLSITFLITLIPANLIAATAAEIKPKALKCNKSKAVAHKSIVIKQPSVVSKRIPKTMTFKTNCGDIVVSLLGDKAPVTVTALTTLARGGYFNQSLCHRLTTQGLFVLQCGDPTATGGGSPAGWKGYVDENLPTSKAMTYPAGTVAMANSGPGTNGSQIFFVYGDSAIGANYTIWGTITKGLDLLKSIAALGAFKSDGNGKYIYAPDGYPVQTVAIEKIIIR